MRSAVFESVGLPEPDGAVYAALVAHPQVTATELGQLCGLSPTLTGRSLARLVRAGIASRISGRTVTFLAAAPDVAIGSLIGQQEEVLRQARSEVHSLMETYREASRYTHPAQSVEVLTGRENIGHRVNQLQEGAREQVRGFDRPPYLNHPGFNLRRVRRRLREGIGYRVIYSREAVAWPQRLENDILVSCAEGEQARVRPELPMKMIMADARQAVIPIGAEEHAVEAAYVIHPSSLLDALVTLFEAEWERAVPIRATDAPHGESAPDDDSRRLLALLASGLTDEAIARSLGWSFRTTQRRLQRLMRELSATTRFQAGMAARERGWL
ncbi:MULTISPECIES: transcriptional regulator [Streptacidiphilus]|uniref:Transcriptional regulator n=1 Tax=Streptacidiphilus cavernicola TaxID=3342716 RepID=A0ABV6UIL7_9ACTN|nr:transcriptional regulator [Streptacidiphilus jeojiense]